MSEENDIPDDEQEERPRRAKRVSQDREKDRKSDATGGVIPYKNPKALSSYYCGVFSLIPCLGGILGPLAIVLGVLGLKYQKANPHASGVAHAYVGIILGSLAFIGNIIAVIMGIVLYSVGT